MTRLKTIGLALLALFVFSAIAATAAQAEEAPYWSIEGTRLAAGKTFEILGKSTEKQTLTAGADKVECEKVEFKSGTVLLGSNAGEPGKSDEGLHYTKCKVAGNGTPCEVTNEEVNSEPLQNELAYAQNKTSLVIEVFPIKGKILAELKFTGSGCSVKSTKVTGVAVAGIFTDATPPVLLELPTPVAQAESFLLKIVPASHSHIWLIKAGVGTEVETEEVDGFGAEATLAGTILVLLGVHGTSLTTKWSPLL